MTPCWLQWTLSVVASPFIVAAVIVALGLVVLGIAWAMKVAAERLPMPSLPPMPRWSSWWSEHGWKVALVVIAAFPMSFATFALQESLWGCEACRPAWLTCDAKSRTP